jgi:hypothetical protein
MTLKRQEIKDEPEDDSDWMGDCIGLGFKRKVVERDLKMVVLW